MFPSHDPAALELGIIDKKWWEANQQNDYFLSSSEALELGIIDKII